MGDNPPVQGPAPPTETPESIAQRCSEAFRSCVNLPARAAASRKLAMRVFLDLIVEKKWISAEAYYVPEVNVVALKAAKSADVQGETFLLRPMLTTEMWTFTSLAKDRQFLAKNAPSGGDKDQGVILALVGAKEDNQEIVYYSVGAKAPLPYAAAANEKKTF
ncbi:hypothetical protein DFJ73DRAFT_824225 [Zopfochytrium polystomum]|nr:hypothetical protein DFJ73DRAFT_824225 [Zopfochytrium polystomum]